MISKTINSPLLHLFTCFFLFFTISGCANKQWRDPIGENEDKSIRELLQNEQEKRKVCSTSIDAELTTTWVSKLSDDGFLKGYIQIFLPSSIKIVALNPLGQPLFAFATDGKKFQSINAVKGVYKYGRLARFVEIYKVPDQILDGDWGQWLTGSINFGDEQLKELRHDVSSRGIWLTVENEKDKATLKEHLLYDPTQRLLLQRVILNQKENEVATIDYTGWQNQKTCRLPTNIQVSGVSFGTTINLEMQDFLTNQSFDNETFYLRLPEGYVQQKYP